MDCGRLFCFGFDGHEAPDSIRFALDRDRVGAVILFARNCRDSDQIRSLTGTLREAGGDELWILVDQEGGRVRRVTDPAIGPPPAVELGRVRPAEVEREYRLAAEALAGLGIDFNLAPVADVLTNPDNPVLAGRAFGAETETVAARVEAAVRGIGAGGLKACAKHFPGLGAVESDPHHAASTWAGSRADFRTVHFPPFTAAIRAGVPAVMTTHLLAPALDPVRIGTYSRDLVTEYLEGELGFGGVVVTDDLEMKAVPDPPPLAARYAFEAGHSLILVCHDTRAQAEALSHFRSAAQGDHAFRHRLHRALDRQAPWRKPWTPTHV